MRHVTGDREERARSLRPRDSEPGAEGDTRRFTEIGTRDTWFPGISIGHRTRAALGAQTEYLIPSLKTCSSLPSFTVPRSD